MISVLTLKGITMGWNSFWVRSQVTGLLCDRGSSFSTRPILVLQITTSNQRGSSHGFAWPDANSKADEYYSTSKKLESINRSDRGTPGRASVGRTSKLGLHCDFLWARGGDK